MNRLMAGGQTRTFRLQLLVRLRAFGWKFSLAFMTLCRQEALGGTERRPRGLHIRMHNIKTLKTVIA